MTREYIVQVSDAIITDAFERFEKEWSPDDLVRCKYCWKRPYDNCPFDEYCGFRPGDDFYCADGERETERPVSPSVKGLGRNQL